MFANKFHTDYEPIAYDCLESRIYHQTLGELKKDSWYKSSYIFLTLYILHPTPPSTHPPCLTPVMIQWWYNLLGNHRYERETGIPSLHDDVMTWKQSPYYWPFTRVNDGILSQRPSDAELWCFLVIGTNCRKNIRVAGEMRRFKHLSDVIVMVSRQHSWLYISDTMTLLVNRHLQP